MRPQTAALYTVGALTAVGLGYVVYFDYKRRSDPNFRKNLKRQRKQAAKVAKAQEEDDKNAKIKLIEKVIVAAAQETYPTTPEEREKYFMEQVAAGEALCGQGPEQYENAILPFYKALKVYPAPMELVMIYQKTVPEPVFTTIVNILAIEQQAMEANGAAAPSGTAEEAAAAAATGAEPEIPIDN
ncbi:mitochondrial import receptor subunit [Lichtheimia corymbifera JMRC:FSU:9682]|uniref:Mitochondrial import receptor subunit TOM20 n=1 Tax=Lichtheimia corymbifera JMRC:FSU:9682 TaxID=1263082 RepID=A0A068S2T3_9FUNG|nr:mitochondrial import receptor subunit [Lichtheimia corymbifera JMRC:FSU:9682]